MAGADAVVLGATDGAVVVGTALDVGDVLVTGDEVLLGAVSPSVLLQPDKRAMVAAADDTASSAARYE